MIKTHGEISSIRPERLGPDAFSRKGTFFLIAGPCVLEAEEDALLIAKQAKAVCDQLGIPYVFKASWDKANRSSVKGHRGPGLEKGLRALSFVRDHANVPILTDVHEPWQCAPVAEVADVLQIPAFLCRQTNLIQAAAETGLPLNLKKGQFLSPWDMRNAVEKAKASTDQLVFVTERGTTFGYNNLVVDMRSLPIMREFAPVVFDATHSLQLPGGKGDSTAGQREYIPHLARAAVAAGVDGLFMEVHPDPSSSPCDAENIFPLNDLKRLLDTLIGIHKKVSRIA